MSRLAQIIAKRSDLGKDRSAPVTALYCLLMG